MGSQQSNSPPQVVELLMKFPCAACDQILNVGVERSRNFAANCPCCESPIRIPKLDRNVAGVEQVLRANPEILKLDCPQCRKTSKVPPGVDLNERWKCPGCGVVLALQVVGSDRVSSPPNQNPTTSRQQRRSENGQPKSKPKKQPSAPPPLEPDFRQHDAPRLEPEPEESRDQSVSPTGVEYHHVSRQSAAPSFDFLSNLSPRRAAWIVWFILEVPVLLFVVLPLLHTAYRITGIEYLPAIAVAWIIPRYGLSAILTWLIMVQFMKSFQCPHCHEEFEAVGRWQCGCGFVDHKQRHFYSFKCPMCRARVGHTNCKRCDATIFLG